MLDIVFIQDYLGINYDDGKVIEFIKDAVIEEFKSIIPNFSEDTATKRQELLMLSFIQEFYDNRTLTEENKMKIRDCINSMLIKEVYKKSGG